MKKSPLIPALAENTPGPSLSEQFVLVFAANNVPQAFSSFKIPAGAAVTLYPFNNNGLNAAACKYVIGRPSLIGTSAGRVIPPGSTQGIILTIDDIGHVYAMGQVDDGLTILVQQEQIG